jgi:transketolase
MDNIERNNVVIVSEGELYEGSTWEALIFMKHHNLTTVKIILDVNRNMILGRPEDCLNLEDISEKFSSFGYKTMRFDGHKYKDIINALDFLFEKSSSPRIIIADTIKGKGVSFMEDKAESHYWAGISEEQMKLMIEDLS